MNLILSLTHDCQFRCGYCYTGDKYRKSITKETIDKSIDLICQYPTQKMEFGFFGGEPLLEWNLLQYATKKMELAASQNNTVLLKTFTTNGSLLTSKKVSWLRKHLFYMIISLDGNEQMHSIHRKDIEGKSTFDAVIRGIGILQKYYNREEYAIMTVITPKNIEYLLESIKYMVEVLSVKNINISPNYFDKWDKSASVCEKALKDVGMYVIDSYRVGLEIKIDFIDDKIKSQITGSCNECSFGEFKMAVAPSGNIYPCERLIGTDSGELSLGNVYDGFDAYKREKILLSRGNIDEECKTCTLKDRCNNSCGCTNYTMTGNINNTSGEVCFFQKIFIAVADMVGNTLYEEKNELFLKKFYG